MKTMAKTKHVSYECLYDSVDQQTGMVMTFYDEGYSSYKKAQVAMRHLHDRAIRNKLNGFLLRNFRIVRHEVIEQETVMKNFKSWDETKD